MPQCQPGVINGIYFSGDTPKMVVFRVVSLQNNKTGIPSKQDTPCLATVFAFGGRPDLVLEPTLGPTQLEGEGPVLPETLQLVEHREVPRFGVAGVPGQRSAH